MNLIRSLDGKSPTRAVLVVLLLANCTSPENSVTKTTWIPFPGGVFTNQQGITKDIAAFDMAATETTVSQFSECVDAMACSPQSFFKHDTSEYYLCNFGRDSRADHPMNCVNWNGAADFCTWKGGRLPTEEEWEYASTHDGDVERKTTYPWGDDSPSHCIHDNYADYVNEVEPLFCDGSLSGSDITGTSEVGSYPRGNSPSGLANLSANVSEWTSSPYEILRDDGNRVQGYAYKGGNFSSRRNLSVAAYGRKPADAISFEIGFRCIIPRQLPE